MNDEGYLTNAGLLFSDNYDKSNSSIVFHAYEGITKNNILIEEAYTGSLLDIYEKGMELFQKYNPIGKWQEKSLLIPNPSYKEHVFKELLVNAIIHKDYYLNKPIEINLFDNRLEVSSPGANINGELFRGKVNSTLVKTK